MAETSRTSPACLRDEGAPGHLDRATRPSTPREAAAGLTRLLRGLPPHGAASAVDSASAVRAGLPGGPFDFRPCLAVRPRRDLCIPRSCSRRRPGKTLRSDCEIAQPSPQLSGHGACDGLHAVGRRACVRNRGRPVRNPGRPRIDRGRPRSLRGARDSEPWAGRPSASPRPRRPRCRGCRVALH